MIFTSEQVSDGHPDKIADQISDAILMECLNGDKRSRVAIETLIKDNNVVVAGELTTKATIDVEEIVLNVMQKIGIKEDCVWNIQNMISKQSPDIALGVDTGGAGDQGMMFGYATNETEELLPIPFVLATKALIYLKKINHPELRPDAKAQVSYDYDKNRIDTFLISTQHTEKINEKELNDVVQTCMEMASYDLRLNTDFKRLVNPTGKFIIGSSFADTGLTGRKIIADTYGSASRHGGGAFSGKDPSKVDRSGAYMARKIAVDLINKKYAEKCEVQIAYAIGVKEPVSVNVNCFGTNAISEVDISEWIKKEYDLTPDGIIKKLRLLNVNYNLTSSYGHFGKSDLPWEY